LWRRKSKRQENNPNQKCSPKQALPEANCRLIGHLDSGINGFIPVFSASSLFSSRKNEIF
jgi:hypothetical protein